MTFRRAMATLIRWSWLVLIVALATALLVREAAESRTGLTATATVRIHEIDVEVGASPNGDPVPFIQQDRLLPTEDELLDPTIARDVAQKLGGITGAELLDGLSMVGLDSTDAAISYKASTVLAAERVVQAYADAYVAAHRAQQRERLIQALATIDPTAAELNRNGNPVRGSGGDPAAKLQSAIDAVPNMIEQVGDVRVETSSNAISPSSATLAGLLAGLALGILIALGIGRFDPRIRRRSALDIPGVGVFGADAEGVARMRVDLELAGIGRESSVVSVTPVDGANVEVVAVDLAHAFADSGTPAVVLEVARDGDPETGVRDFLENGDGTLTAAQVSEDVAWISAGGASVPDERLFSASSVTRLLDEARKHGRVVILVTESPADHAESLLAIGGADVALLVVRSQSSWSQLEGTVDQVRRVARRSMRLVFERGSRSVTWPAPIRAMREHDTAGV